MIELLTSPEAWMALATLTVLEIVLGIDNIIFISILVGRLPEEKRNFARIAGLSLAMITRLMLLFSLAWLAKLTDPWITIFGHSFSGRDLILLVGGLFLLVKATNEIHHSLEGIEESEKTTKAHTMGAILFQIALFDIIFSLDSVITAVGLVQEIAIMATAVIGAVIVMLFAAKGISDFVDNHPTIKILALSFLFLVGATLIGESLGMHVAKGYIYFAMAFSVVVEMINIRMRKKSAAVVELHKRLEDTREEPPFEEA